MEFEYSDTFCVIEEDLERMCNMVESGYSPQLALNEISSEWDDEAFYTVGKVEEKIIEEIKKRVDKRKRT